MDFRRRMNESLKDVATITSIFLEFSTSVLNYTSLLFIETSKVKVHMKI